MVRHPLAHILYSIRVIDYMFYSIWYPCGCTAKLILIWNNLEGIYWLLLLGFISPLIETSISYSKIVYCIHSFHRKLIFSIKSLARRCYFCTYPVLLLPKTIRLHNNLSISFIQTIDKINFAVVVVSIVIMHVCWKFSHRTMPSQILFGKFTLWL